MTATYDASFNVRVGSVEVMRGSRPSMSLMFEKLTGNSFVASEDPIGNFRKSLFCLSSQLGIEIHLAAEVRLSSPNGVLLRRGYVGEATEEGVAALVSAQPHI